VYATPALIPASPLLGKRAPARPTMSLRVDAASDDEVLRITPAASSKVAWWTVRAQDADGAWRTWILPGAQTQLIVSAAGQARSPHVVVTAVDRLGNESAPRSAEQRQR
jgi:phage baseplate assembly protein gpV